MTFGFGFDQIDSSDRVLHIQIIPDLASNDDPDGGKNGILFLSNIDASDSECRATDFEVRILHVSSHLLAAKSPVFYKLFKNGTTEAQNKNAVTLRMTASEEAAFMELLNFIYGNPLNASSAPDLLDVLMAANEFEVTACLKHCFELLLKLPMSVESAVCYLKLQSSVAVGEEFQPLVDAATRFLLPYFDGSLRGSPQEQKAILGLPPCALEAVLGSDEHYDPQVYSEDGVLDFILEWGRTNYPNLERRRLVLTSILAPLVYFNEMSVEKLKDVVYCPDFEYEQLSKMVLDALFFKLNLVHLPTTTKFSFSKRSLSTRVGEALSVSRI